MYFHHECIEYATKNKSMSHKYSLLPINILWENSCCLTTIFYQSSIVFQVVTFYPDRAWICSMNELTILYATCISAHAKIAAVHNALSVISDTEFEWNLQQHATRAAKMTRHHAEPILARWRQDSTEQRQDLYPNSLIPPSVTACRGRLLISIAQVKELAGDQVTADNNKSPNWLTTYTILLLTRPGAATQ